MTACSGPPSYQLRGQIVVVDTARQELTIKHGDIKGFMPAMTMPFKVQDAAMMSGKNPGDTVEATLVIENERGSLTRVEVTGHEALTEPPPRPPASDLLVPGEAVPDVQLVDETGASRRLSEWRGKVLAVTFIYTRCPLPNFCPLMDRHFAAVQREAAGDASLGDALHLLSVTLDPAFDRPPVLLEHAHRLGAQPALWSFATGERDDLDRFGARFGVSIIRDDPAEVVHNLRTVVIDRTGRLTTIFPGNEWSAADLLKELRRAAGIR